MEDTQKNEKIKRVKKKKTLKDRLKKKLFEAFGVEKTYHIIIVIVGALLIGFLVEFYIST